MTRWEGLICPVRIQFYCCYCICTRQQSNRNNRKRSAHTSGLFQGVTPATSGEFIVALARDVATHLLAVFRGGCGGGVHHTAARPDDPWCFSTSFVVNPGSSKWDCAEEACF